jgi:ATP-dependent DNA helicase Q1
MYDSRSTWNQDTETLLVELLLARYLEESYSANSYAVNVYVVPGPQALRLTRISRQDIEKNKGPRVECFFRKPARKSKAAEKERKRVSKKSLSTGRNGESSRKRKRQPTPDADDDPDDFVVDNEDGMESGGEIEAFSHELQEVDGLASEPEDGDWTFSMSSHAKKKPRKSGETSNALEPPSGSAWDDGEIITLLSD